MPRYSQMPASGLEGKLGGLAAELLKPAEERLVAHAGQALVDEHLRGAEHHAAVDVVLHLHHGRIADPHRLVVLEAGEVGRDPFIERQARDDAVHRLQVGVLVEGDVGDVVDVGFHGLRRAEAIERVHHEEGVA